tara:strand:- start:254 stop:526 length:273 start_codon:yes stop_codon:yes gene_type:complete
VVKLLLDIERHIDKIGGEISQARTSLLSGNSVKTNNLNKLSKKLFSVCQNSFQNSRDLKELKAEAQINLLIRNLDDLEKLVIEASQKLSK